MDGMVFASTLIQYHTQSQTHTGQTGTNHSFFGVHNPFLHPFLVKPLFFEIFPTPY